MCTKVSRDIAIEKHPVQQCCTVSSVYLLKQQSMIRIKSGIYRERGAEVSKTIQNFVRLKVPNLS